ncbi:MAG: hypothetical protein IVW54_13385 [Candidatus Binataceae bacterium]|nr:hypothetical protein [Candidatus Binataceae bacterium]
MISKPSMFDYTSRSTKIAFISPAALLNQNRFLEADVIVREQCRFRTPDPLFFVPDEERSPQWVFAGRLDRYGDFQALEYRSMLTLGLAKGTTQLNSWPVELVSLADMPQVFLEQRLELTAKSKLPPDDAKEMVENYMRQAQQIEEVVARLEKSYNPQIECLPKKSG